MRRCYTTNQIYQNYSAQMDMSIVKMWAFYKKISNSNVTGVARKLEIKNDCFQIMLEIQFVFQFRNYL
jgi:hypothetical protein